MLPSTDIKTHFIRFKSCNTRTGKDELKTVFLSTRQYEKIIMAIEKRQSDIYIEPIKEYIPKRRYENVGVLSDTERSSMNFIKNKKYRFHCRYCNTYYPLDMLDEHDYECRKKYYKEQKNL